MHLVILVKFFAFFSQDNIQRILLSLAVRIQTTHRLFEKRRYLLSYHLFIKLLCRELHSDLEDTRPFIIMDTIATIVRVLSSGTRVVELFPLCCDTLDMVCRASLEHCPDELVRHLHTVVALLTLFAQNKAAPVKEKVAND